MKRFWKEVSVEPEGEGWTIRLDGRPIKTPARAALEVPSDALAEAIAEEWRAVGGKIDPDRGGGQRVAQALQRAPHQLLQRDPGAPEGHRA